MKTIEERAGAFAKSEGYTDELDIDLITAAYIAAATQQEAIMKQQIDEAIKDFERVRNQYRNYKEGTNGAGVYNGLAHAITFLTQLRNKQQ